MNKEHALEFLTETTPIAWNKSQELLDEYHEVIQYFRGNPDERCIRPLLTHAANDPGGFFRDEVKDTLAKYPDSALVPIVLDILSTKGKEFPYWAIEFSWDLDDERLARRYRELIHSTDDLVRGAAVVGLWNYVTKNDKAWIEEKLKSETDEEVVHVLSVALERANGRQSGAPHVWHPGE